MATELRSHAEALEPADFARCVGLREDELAPDCVEALETGNFGYRTLTGPDREARLLEALRRSDSDELTISGPHRADDWERGWGENLAEFAATGGSTDALVPKYNGHGVLRLGGEYVQVEDPGFEYAFYDVLRRHEFGRWFADCDRVAEFGCGTGTSLLLLHELFPNMELFGFDWAESSQEILTRLAERTRANLTSGRFDMFDPASTPTDPELFGPRTGVLTSAAMEQLGPDHTAFVDYLLEAKPAICLHIEPLVELYDEDSLFDEVVIRYHTRRNYLRGFVPRLRELADAGTIELLELRRTGFGCFWHEGYSVAVWRPVT